MNDPIRMLVTVTPPKGDERSPMEVCREITSALSVGLALTDRVTVNLIDPSGDVLDPVERWRIVERDENDEQLSADQLVDRVLTYARKLGRRAREDAAIERAERRADLDLDEVVNILRTVHGIENAFVETTGGDTACILAGPTRVEPNFYGPRYAAVAGSGWFEGPGFTRARADLSEFFVGPDDDGDATPVTVPPGTSVEKVAALIAAQAQQADPSLPLGADDLERLGLDPGLRGPAKVTSTEYTEE